MFRLLAEQTLAFDIRAQAHGAQSLHQTHGHLALADRGDTMGDRQEARGNGAVAFRQVGVVAVLAQGRGALHGIGLVAEAEQRDLGADHGAVGLVEVQQFQGLVVAGVFQIEADEASSVALQAAIFQVHREEGEVGADIGEAERFVEFDAVEQHYPAVDQRGVAQVDVAVAFADEALRLALLEHRQQAFEAAFRPGFEGIQLLQVGLVLEQRANLLEILPHRRHAGLGGAQRVLQRHLRSVLVEVRDLLGQFVNMLVGQFAAALDCRQQVVLRELAHLQQVFDCLAVAADPRRLFAAGDRQDLQVEIVGEALIQAQLFVAIEAALVQAGEIEKAEIHRLLDLVGVGTGQQDPGDVRLDDLEALHRVGVEGRVLQGGDQGLAHGISLPLKYAKTRIMAGRGDSANLAGG